MTDPCAMPPSTLARLTDWLAPRLPGLDAAGATLQAKRLPAGQSNPTWLLSAGGQTGRTGGAGSTWVMRCKPGPQAELLPSAHAIEREVAVLRALQGTAVPVPQVHALCEDESVIGVAFYVMDFVEGRILRDATLPDFGRADRAALHDDALRVLAALHGVDWRARGLASFGRHEGHFERMVARWTKQFRATSQPDSDAAGDMQRLAEWLSAHIPPESPGEPHLAIVHGDYRLENLVVHAREPRVIAVLDWELATLGHPLSDLGYHAMAWHLPQGTMRGIAGLDLAAAGIPDPAALIGRYCALAGRGDAQAVQAHWPFYLAVNLFRLAAILQGIAHRVAQGIASHPQAIETGRMAAPVARLGWQIASGAQRVI